MECNKQSEATISESQNNDNSSHQNGQELTNLSFEEVLDLIHRMQNNQGAPCEQIASSDSKILSLEPTPEIVEENSPEEFIIKEKFLLKSLNLSSENSESTEGSEGSPKKVSRSEPKPSLPTQATLKSLSHKLSQMVQNSDLENVDDEVISSLKSLTEKELYSNPIYFSRHGQSIFNTKELIGGDSLLSDKGKKYAEGLRNFFQQSKENFDDLHKYCSTLKRTQQTISYLSEVGAGAPTIRSEIDEINAGICDSMTYEDIQERFPEEFQLRKKDKLNYRYPDGESYIDLKARLKPFLEEVEASETPVLVISHQATLRCVHAYLKGLKSEEIPYIQVPLHSLIKFERSIFGYRETVYKYDTENETFSKEVHKVNLLDSFLEEVETLLSSRSSGLQERMPALIQT